MIYIGALEDNKVNRLYISSVPVDDPHFDTESVLADCSPRGRTDWSAAMLDVRILRNKLSNGGVPHNLITMDDSQ
jgi:hypothetical protein